MYKHIVKKWNGKAFVNVESSSNLFYSLSSGLDYDESLDVEDVESLEDLYRLWCERKESDKYRGEMWYYELYKHEVIRGWNGTITEGYIQKTDAGLRFIEY